MPGCVQFSDEGAANHNLICKAYDQPGIDLFIYNKNHYGKNKISKFPLRQSLQASQSISNLHKLNAAATIFAEQTLEVIEQGVFHNDVIFVGNKDHLLYHEKSFIEQGKVFNKIKENYGDKLHCIEIAEKDLSVTKAVSSYFFNSQLISTTDSQMAIIAPVECQEDKTTADLLNTIISSNDNLINEVHFVSCRQSMKNGGGPACLRLRVILTDNEQKSINKNFILSDELYLRLTS